MKVHIKLGSWKELGLAARKVRHQVFVIEQNIPVDMERDDMDEPSLHAVAFDEAGEAVGTARLLPDFHIGRMAVLERMRGQGLGSCLLQTMMQVARERGAVEVVVNAQVDVMPLYRRHGFVEEGAEFDDAGIPHRCMRHRFESV